MKEKPFSKTDWASWESFFHVRLIIFLCLSYGLDCLEPWGRTCSRERGWLVNAREIFRVLPDGHVQGGGAWYLVSDS